MREYLVTFKMDEGGIEQELRYRVIAPNRQVALVYGAMIMGALGNHPNNTVITGSDVAWLK